MSTSTHRNGRSRSRTWIIAGVVGSFVVLGLVVALLIGFGRTNVEPVASSGSTSRAPTTSAAATSAVAPSPTTASASSSAASDSTVPAPESRPSTAGSMNGVVPSQAATGPTAATGTGTEQPQVASARKIGDNADVADRVSVRITAIEATQGQAEGVGEVSGPAIKVTFELKNSTSSPVSTASAVADVDYGTSRTPADELRGKRPATFANEIAPGGTTSASFIYLVPQNQRNDLRITFFLDPATPAAQFTGSAA